ncbi:hypothetical protein E5E91_02255 [Deinococcus radiodurans R1 = ATCC 13939 = DSM 20539]|uniref:Uncharacterized protein n=1 Tax=Deinococcus radiodurans (strain ATCC 13939 / DSM 20539 / JCM 16871 / CCUG 27074 / LMG 4051 / NBRC 15346 / NCIMB 9279 / VKM B-1422 / R1) TaxID=243230 RepID=Q9RX77_DEIRA|nr:hypothetical protein DR_0438 [Deinococcus radiodurans R1 = ATCC 13939 = DSM 20539]QEM72390.1 hypothetical protein DXG80_11850 [Deinococcus radiodurans]UDK99623.1 hypothetical protein E5E91_02255 [Deinococcus radiodurans R1 = ATCC 13939 = DSM 20539]HCE63931.1 hypothetical protein [Deinococcus radiodurans]
MHVLAAAAGGVPDLGAELPGEPDHKLNGVLVALLDQVSQVLGQTVGQGHGAELVAVFAAELLEPLGVRVRRGLARDGRLRHGLNLTQAHSRNVSQKAV